MVPVGWLRRNWLRVLVHAGSLMPLAWLVWQYWQGLFLVDPIKQTEDSTGRTALILLVLSLACTPVSTVFGLKEALRVRRALGLYAFGYIGLHFVIFTAFDYRLDFARLVPALLGQRYVLMGFLCGLILIPLAITSTRGWQRRLRMNWKRLHWLVFPAGVLAVLHFLWSVKDYREPLRYGAVVALLLALRLPWVHRTAARARRAMVARLKGSTRNEA